MYNNEPFEEYIRQVLGYHNIEKAQIMILQTITTII